MGLSGAAVNRHSKSLFPGRPALTHEREQMSQGVVLVAALFGGELAGALIQLRGHVGGFLRRTAQGH